MNYCYYTTFQPVQTKRGVTQVFKNIPNHSLCDLHTILNEHASIISIQEPLKRKKIIFVYFCIFLSVDFVNILPKSGCEQTFNTRFAEMVTKCHKFGFFGKIKIQFFKKHFSKKEFEKNIFSPFFLK